jgi:hypothetical protein
LPPQQNFDPFSHDHLAYLPSWQRNLY